MLLLLFLVVVNIAAATPQSGDVTVSSVVCEVRKDSITETIIRFKSDATIPAFQKVEISGNTAIFRIPNGINNAALSKIKATGLVKSIKAQRIKTMLVYRIALRQKPTFSDVQRSGTSEIMVRLSASKKAPNEPEDANAKHWKCDVVVLDAGHGGEDVGAIGVSGCIEKVVTLSITKQVQQILSKEMPNLKVVLTRPDDSYIDKYLRGQIANEKKGKLFVSIHCNSANKKPHPARGFETYILRPGRTDDAIAVAERENTSIRNGKDQAKQSQNQTAEQLMIATLAQHSFVQLSEDFAHTLQTETAKTTKQQSRGVNQAGFVVLIGASMPSVLFETAFLSNERDEDYVCNEKGQQQFAKSIATAIVKYVKTYNTSIGARL